MTEVDDAGWVCRVVILFWFNIKSQNSFSLQIFKQRHPQKVPNQMNEITIGCSIEQFPSNAFWNLNLKNLGVFANLGKT
jgi:hypothetical protein